MRARRRTRPGRVVGVDGTRPREARQNVQLCPVLLELRTKVWLECNGVFVIGDGGMRLLEEIDSRGSLLAAARQLGWSYRHAWQYLRRAEGVFGRPLVIPRPGKGARRGTELTAEGKYLLGLLRAARRRVDRSVGASGPTREEIAVRGSYPAQRRPVG